MGSVCDRHINMSFWAYWSSNVDILQEEVCIERGVVSLTIMLYSQHNVDRLLISYIILMLLKSCICFFFINISDVFTYICVNFKSFKTYKGRTLSKMHSKQILIIHYINNKIYILPYITTECKMLYVSFKKNL